MLFKARNRESLWKRFRVWAWPRTSWARSARYYLKRVMRLSSNPHSVAAGCASGVAVSFTPFIGFHFVAAFVLAFAVRGNMLAAAIGTAAGNPLTFPFIWAATYEIGQLILGETNGAAPSSLSQSLTEKSMATIWPIIEPMLIGSIPLSLFSGAMTYVVIYKLVSTYQKRKQDRMDQLAQEAAAEMDHAAAAALAKDQSKRGPQKASGG